MGGGKWGNVLFFLGGEQQIDMIIVNPMLAWL